jgi:uncharacterized protein
MNWKRLLFMGSAIILALIGMLYLVVLGVLWTMQEQLMFGRRTSSIVETPAARNWSFEEVWMEVAGERTHGWWLPVTAARGVVLFSHGSGRNISGYLDDVALFHEAGLSVLLYDYGGYGLSTGEPSEQRCYADAQAFWDYLVTRQDIAPDTILLAGSSMGSGVTCELATRVSPAAVILESAFTSVPDALWDTAPYFPTNWICRIQFRNVDKVRGFTCPVLVIHSKDDTVVPVAHGRRLYDSINAPKTFIEIEGAHYGGKFKSKEAYLQGLNTFIEEYVALHRTGR